MMYPFDIQAGTCNKYLSSFFANPSSINVQHLNVNIYPALSNNPLHGCQVWSLHLHGQSRAWVRLCWSTFYLCLKLVDNWPYILSKEFSFLCIITRYHGPRVMQKYEIREEMIKVFCKTSCNQDSGQKEIFDRYFLRFSLWWPKCTQASKFLLKKVKK